MTPEQAGKALGILTAGFPRDALEPESAQLWIAEVALLTSPEVAIEAARLVVRSGDRFPTVKEFRQVYHAVNARHAEAIQKLPVPALSTQVPEWVYVWWWARLTTGHEAWRPFPQQEGAELDPDVLSVSEYEELREGWVAAGSPAILSARDLVAAIA